MLRIDNIIINKVFARYTYVSCLISFVITIPEVALNILYLHDPMRSRPEQYKSEQQRATFYQTTLLYICISLQP